MSKLVTQSLQKTCTALKTSKTEVEWPPESYSSYALTKAHQKSMYKKDTKPIAKTYAKKLFLYELVGLMHLLKNI